MLPYSTVQQLKCDARHSARGAYLVPGIALPRRFCLSPQFDPYPSDQNSEKLPHMLHILLACQRCNQRLFHHVVDTWHPYPFCWVCMDIDMTWACPLVRNELSSCPISPLLPLNLVLCWYHNFGWCKNPPCESQHSTELTIRNILCNDESSRAVSWVRVGDPMVTMNISMVTGP